MPDQAAYYRWEEQDWWKWTDLFELGGANLGGDDLEGAEFD